MQPAFSTKYGAELSEQVTLYSETLRTTGAANVPVGAVAEYPWIKERPPVTKPDAGSAPKHVTKTCPQIVDTEPESDQLVVPLKA